MPLLMALLGNKWTWIALALAGASAWGAIQTMRLDSAKARLKAVQAEFKGFKAQVAAEGKVAQKRANKQAADDKQRKEKADAEQKRVVSLLNQRVASLRHDADSRSSYRLPAAPAGTARPDLACFDRAELTGSVGILEEGVPRITQQGDEARLDLDTAKAWAQGR